MPSETTAAFLRRALSVVGWITYTGVATFFLPRWVFVASIAALAGLGLHEFFGMVERKGVVIYRALGTACGVAVPLLTAVSGRPPHVWALPALFGVCLLVWVLSFSRQRTDGVTFSLAATMLGMLYAAFSLSYLISVRDLPGGIGWVIYFLLVTKSGDMGAYVVGTGWGRHRLIPRISPRKSVEGLIGGCATSVVVAVAARGVVGPLLSLPASLLLGGLLAALAQAGDLAESLVKRDCGVKDSGAVFPGLGGVLDTLDSLLFTAPVFYWFIVR